MRSFNLCLFFIFFVNTYSQKNVTIEYQNFYDTNTPLKRTSILYINGSENFSLFQDMLSTSKPWLKDIDENKEETTIASMRRNMDIFILTDNLLNRTIYEDFSQKYFAITDTLKLQWEISDENKFIDKYKCYKATTVFRGIIWEAWFTYEIPFSFGPWKLNGLPGVILQANDVNKVYTFNVKNIKIDNLISVNVPEKNFEILNIQDYVKLKDEFYLNLFESVARDDRDVVIERKTNLRNTIEPKYEWEE